MNKLPPSLTVFLILSLILAACGGGGIPAAADQLAEIYARGTIVVATDWEYPPQAQYVAGASRSSNTKCSPEQRTTNELVGFDVDIAVEIARRMGVEACFVNPEWGQITAGGWDDRWDISIGSMTITAERMKNLYFTQPYYTTPAAFFVHQENIAFSQPSDLVGGRIGACSDCTYNLYLSNNLNIPGEEIVYVVQNPKYVRYESDQPALQDLSLGDGVRLDAALTALPTGMTAIENGMPLKPLGEPVFTEYLAAAIDRRHSTNPMPFVQRVNEIMLAMHEDGTLLSLSQLYYGLDLTTEAANFDTDILSK